MAQKRARTVRPDKRESEAEFMQAVIRLAELCHFMVYHTYDSRRSNPGFPDLVLVKDGRLIFAELKTASGRLSQYQRQWLFMLGLVDGIEVAVWRPEHWPDIVNALMHNQRIPASFDTLS